MFPPGKGFVFALPRNEFGHVGALLRIEVCVLAEVSKFWRGSASRGR